MGAVASDINPISAIAKAVASMCHDCTKFVLNSCESECDCCSCWKFGFHTYKVSDSDSDSSNVPCCDYWRVFFKGGANLTPPLRIMEKWHNFSPRKLWCLRGLSYSDKPWRVFSADMAQFLSQIPPRSGPISWRVLLVNLEEFSAAQCYRVFR